MLSFVLLQLEPLFRYDSAREWSGESTDRCLSGGKLVLETDHTKCTPSQSL
ncbi:BQ5605_C006g03748 [Microbotryum silenes-dioicae]|uniref:BQ5605_C006g03738 protein n=1 Tax=Microbotryum silenes-dioicae TaxID=796604 RepID=A0A2X0NS06_9BASI|nr:BQ5605_C017g08298 [Microbotryum silenes-dioicae]SGY53235.1 BQ5605_C006g03738 [Microbotryum silenes-dioicae]SGY53338.1 BQ5605_C006g03748 [Microbotryum silenes-dioicae]